MVSYEIDYILLDMIDSNLQTAFSSSVNKCQYSVPKFHHLAFSYITFNLVCCWHSINEKKAD